MKYLSFYLIFLVFFSGCGTVPVSGTQVDQTVSEPILEDQETYKNTHFGYSFVIPEGLAVYTLTDEQLAVPATEDSETIFLIDGETNFFTIRGIEDSTKSAHEWLSDHFSFFYPTGEAGQRVGDLAGQQAFFLSGDGTATSPARLIVVEFEEKTIVITYEKEVETFDTLLDSIQFIHTEG